MPDCSGTDGSSGASFHLNSDCDFDVGSDSNFDLAVGSVAAAAAAADYCSVPAPC